MRIIAGEAGGINLKSIKNSNARPTLDRVKEALFSIIAPYIRDTKVLDLFSGFGNLGLEAVSRGAKNAILVERSRKNINVIKKNIDLCNFNDRIQLVKDDVFKYLEYSTKDFDIIFMDPPYDKQYGNDLLKKIKSNNILKKNGLIVIEHSEKEIISSQDFIKIKEKNYGNTVLTILENREEN